MLTLRDELPYFLRFPTWMTRRCRLVPGTQILSHPKKWKTWNTLGMFRSEVTPVQKVVQKLCENDDKHVMMMDVDMALWMLIWMWLWLLLLLLLLLAAAAACEPSLESQTLNSSDLDHMPLDNA